MRLLMGVHNISIPRSFLGYTCCATTKSSDKPAGARGEIGFLPGSSVWQERLDALSAARLRFGLLMDGKFE